MDESVIDEEEIYSKNQHRDWIQDENQARQKKRSQFRAVQSPAVIGRFADDSSSQKSNRVRNQYFTEAEISIDNLDDIQLKEEKKQTEKQNRSIEYMNFDISQLQIQTTAEVEVSQLTY